MTLFPFVMKTVFRLGAIGAFVAVLGFCVFGMVATFEPMPTRDRVIWRTVYSLVGLASTLGLFRLLRCQLHRWFRPHHLNSDPATQN